MDRATDEVEGSESVSLLRVEKHRNGDGYTSVSYYSCDRCGKEVCEMDRHVTGTEANTHYCMDCGFIKQLIDEQRYLECFGLHGTRTKARVRDEKIVMWTGKTPPWEMTDKDHRNTQRYKDWRSSIFERDEYTCQECRQVGGELEAHHIKPFSTYKSLRYTKSNGVTLCKECHRLRHRRLKKEGVKYG